MRYRLGFGAVSALVASLIVGGCNIFGSEERAPGSKAEALQAELNSFLTSGAKGTISSQTLLEVAKESREKSGIGVLEITRELSQSQGSGSAGVSRFPFDSLSSATRADRLEHLQRMDQALALILFANKAQAGGGKLAAGSVPDAQLILAASRVELDPAIDPCSVYPDFLIVRLLRVMTEFRAQFDAVDQTVRDNVEIIGTSTGYRLRWKTGTPTTAQKAQVNGIIDWIAKPGTGAIYTMVGPMLDPMGEFGCESPLSDIIDLDKVQTYMYNTLAASLLASKL